MKKSVTCFLFIGFHVPVNLCDICSRHTYTYIHIYTLQFIRILHISVFSAVSCVFTLIALSSYSYEEPHEYCKTFLHEYDTSWLAESMKFWPINLGMLLILLENYF